MTAIDWLLDGDPSIRWQALADLADAPADRVAAARADVARTGLGAQILARQTPGGAWDSGEDGPDWATLRALLWLRAMGLDPASPEAHIALDRVRATVVWQGAPGDAWSGRPLFAGEVEPCINGRVVAVGAYFGEDVQVVVDRLVGEQMADGGWNCEQENGSRRGSFGTTINVLEGLAEHARAAGDEPAVNEAIRRGHEYLLARRLFRRASTGEVADAAFTTLGFPSGWHYDILRCLDHLRAAGARPDGRTAEAVAIVASKRDGDGRWPLEVVHESEPPLDPTERPGEASRWITLKALRVLRWAE
jgi:hypothetical protein